MANPYLLIGLTAGPLTLQRIISRVDESRWDERVDPNRFNFREAVAHLADWEPIHLARLRAAHLNPGSVIQAYDEGQLAIDHQYRLTDPIDEAARWIDRREITVRYLRETQDGTWAHRVTHSERGEMTFEDLANLIIGHDIYHLEHLSRYL